MRLVPFISAIALALAPSMAAQTRTVALTIDDLPFVAAHDDRPMQPVDAQAAAAANRRILSALARHHVPVTGFVIQKGVEELGMDAGSQILQDWTTHGFDLGNHSYAHLDFNDLTVEQFEGQIIRGETTFVPLMKAAGRNPEFFRFPYNHTGDNREKHDAIAVFLAQRRYRLAPCTIETSDWLFNRAYGRILARHDGASAARLRAEYLAFTAEQIDYFDGLSRKVLGYNPPQIMLIHDNQLNADVIEDLLAIFEKKQFRWISLSDAEADAVYRRPETFITKFGPMWGYRWAKEGNVEVEGRLEQDPPKWIVDYGK
jgi:peptidoglycan/xylan/chitin deacetylase (PgdA/CDA1 family)